MSPELIASTKLETFAYKVKVSNFNMHLIKDCKNGECFNYWFSKSKIPKFGKRCYKYISDRGLELLSSKPILHFKDEDWKEFWLDLCNEELNEYSVERLFYAEYSSSSIFRYNKKEVVASCWSYNYIDGISDRDYHLDEVFTYLSTHPYIKSCEIEDIPYYNVESDFTRGIKMVVLLPQSKVDELWNFYKDHEFSTTNIKGDLTSINSRFDSLGIKQFLKA